MLESLQRHDGWLQERNPVVKLLVLFGVIAVMLFVNDPWTPLFMVGLAGLLLRLLGAVSFKTFLMYLAPFSLFALSFLWIHTFFPGERGETVLFTLGPMTIARENVMTGLAFGMRAMVFASWSLLFIMTTEPSKLMLSLIQHLRLPARYGYGIMAAYRFLPILQEELRTIRAAHRIRGLGESGGIRGKWNEIKRYAIPLLAGAIRKADRVAIAMESKGFDDSRDRVFYREIRFTVHDVLYGLLMFALLAAVLYFK